MVDEERRLGRMFGDAYELWQRETYGGLEAAGFPDIRPAHSPVFRHIQPHGSRVVGLAAAADMTKQSMAYLVGSLEESGYVEINADPNDGRARLVCLTSKGQQLKRYLESRSRAFERRLADTMGAQKVADLKVLVSEVLEAKEAASGE
ncbi:MarR family winged helix-turn-helix transcriptional regulator [Aurantiacibacter hainanensis]|uniref:MarR family winged helix-turn-helix transcriptional regulator n=1 Tax=Aurantiacibacter hainanensis TaxID=3076114 RepID=UPI0030C75E1F